MKILAIESSGNAASAAIMEDKEKVAYKMGPFKVTHSQTLMPLIEDCFAQSALSPADIDVVAVSAGPGSFTGLRIGSATAKGLCFALDKKLVHVPTLQALAMNVRLSGRIGIPIMDARRGQVYTGIYSFEEEYPHTLLPQTAMSISELIDIINESYSGESVIFLGDAVDNFKDIIENECKADVIFAKEDEMLQMATSVGLLGYEMAVRGQFTDPAQEAPEYLRPSQAERVRAEKEKKDKEIKDKEVKDK